MKKRITIIFRCVYGAVFLAVIFLIIFSNINRMRGEISITINGEEYLLNDLECKYIGGEESYEKLSLRDTESGLKFKSAGSHHGLYQYSFDVNYEELNINPQILVFKSNWWEIYVMDIRINIYKEKDAWNAEVLFEIDGNTYQETFYDIENTEIEFRYN